PCASHALRSRFPTRRSSDLVTLDGNAIHEHALAEVHEVRRSVLADAQAASPQQRFGRGERAALSVRAGDVDDRILAMRITQRVEDRKSTRLNSSHEWISYAV